MCPLYKNTYQITISGTINPHDPLRTIYCRAEHEAEGERVEEGTACAPIVEGSNHYGPNISIIIPRRVCGEGVDGRWSPGSLGDMQQGPKPNTKAVLFITLNQCWGHCAAQKLFQTLNAVYGSTESDNMPITTGC